MLLRPMMEPSYVTPDQLYNPLTNFSQTELMEKFNLAFYEAQTVSKSDILETLKELQDTVSSPKASQVPPEDKTNDDYLIEYLISEDSAASHAECDINFDFNDFVEDFDQNVRDSFSDSTTIGEFDTETFTTESSKDYEECTGESTKQFSNFFVPPPIWSIGEKEYENVEDSFFAMNKQTDLKSLEKNDFEDIDICEVLSNASLDIGDWSSRIQDLDQQDNEYSISSLPPVGTITKNNFDFNCYVRNIPEDDMGYFKQDPESKSEFGHLIGTSGNRNYEFIVNTYEKDQKICHVLEENHMVLTQEDALLNDDPLLSSSNNFYTSHSYMTPEPDDIESDIKNEEDKTSPFKRYQCKWETCYQKCHNQTSLVSHIEKCHVEVKRGDEFTCFWEHCPRKTKPFNARYKLLIHMRVHSGEKPNKCPFKGCNKAFSRLENLKIHQRSHTGERPYLCQFTGCSKCFSNSSDRAKHQRTHFDTKPYACQVMSCFKKYTDPSSLRKHVKNHTHDEQLQIKKKSQEEGIISNSNVKKLLDPSRQKAIKIEPNFSPKTDHTYSSLTNQPQQYNKYLSMNVKQDLKNKIEKNKIRRTMF